MTFDNRIGQSRETLPLSLQDGERSSLPDSVVNIHQHGGPPLPGSVSERKEDMTIPVDTIQQAIRHPLDPLTPEEVEKTTRVLKASGHITPRVRIMAYSLVEPAKEVALAFQAGQPLAREVFAVMRDHERRLTVEAIVSLADETIRSWRERSDVQPALTYPEVFAAQQAVLADAAFQQAMQRRGISDLSSVVIYPWTA